MGLAHLRADPPVAVGHLEEALKRSPGHVEGMCLLAWALEKNAQDDAQAQWLERIEQAGGPDTAAGWFFLGQAVVRQDPNRANNAFRRAIDLRAQYYQAIIHLARAQNHEMYHRRTTYDFGEIRSRLELACQAQSRAAYPCYLLSLAYRLSAEIYRDAGRADEAAPRFDNARKWAEEAITREPTSPRGFAALAEYHESLGAYENAIAAWERAEPHCSAIPDEYELREYRWRLLLWAGRHDEALRDIDRLEQLDGASDADHPWMARWFRAVLLADRGEFDRATNELHAVMRDHADSRRARVDCLTLMRWIGHATNAPVAISHRGDSPELIGSLSPAVSPAASEAVVRLCDGDAELSQIESDVAAFPSDNKRVWAPVWFVQSGRMAATGHRDRAIAALRACRDCYDDEHYCYRAKLLLALLRDRPEWPS
jgi:tetratricopeptide (TPR) repeat protein